MVLNTSAVSVYADDITGFIRSSKSGEKVSKLGLVKDCQRKSWKVREFSPRKPEGQEKSEEIFEYIVTGFQKLYFFKCVNLDHQNLIVFPHLAYNLCSVSCQSPRRFLFVILCFYRFVDTKDGGNCPPIIQRGCM